MSLHRVCCCTPGQFQTCAQLMCIPEHPTTLVVYNINGIKQVYKTLNDVTSCINNACNYVDQENQWRRRGEFWHEVQFTMPPTTLRRSGTNCCYIADNPVVNITWRYQWKNSIRGCRCVNNQPGPLYEDTDDLTGTITVPACYRVECVSVAGFAPYLVHRLSWCATPAPATIPFSKVTQASYCNGFEFDYNAGLWINSQQLCWRSPIMPLIDLVPGDYDPPYWCGCTQLGGDAACTSANQTVHPCLTAQCLAEPQNSWARPFCLLSSYDDENPPAACTNCGCTDGLFPCDGVVNLCSGGNYEVNDPCYDCGAVYAVSTPLYL